MVGALLKVDDARLGLFIYVFVIGLFAVVLRGCERMGCRGRDNALILICYGAGRIGMGGGMGKFDVVIAIGICEGGGEKRMLGVGWGMDGWMVGRILRGFMPLGGVDGEREREREQG